MSECVGRHGSTLIPTPRRDVKSPQFGFRPLVSSPANFGESPATTTRVHFCIGHWLCDATLVPAPGNEWAPPPPAKLRRPLVSSLEKAACRGSSGASRCSRDSTSEFSRTFDAVFAKVDDRTHCPSGWLDSGGVFAGVDRQLVMRPDPATQYPGTANVLWRVFHFLGLSAAELSSTGSGRTTDPALEDIAAVATRAELTVTALDEKANVWVAFKQGGQPVAVIVVEVKGNVGRVKPKVGVSIYAVTAAAAPGSATTIEEALDLTSSESKKDRRLLTDELKALLGEAPNLRRWAHMRVLSHASVNDDDIEWRI